MNKTAILLLVLATVAMSYCPHSTTSSSSCSPAIKINNCRQAFCYRCNRNQVFNPDTLYCECKPGYKPINGFCGKCREGYQYDPVMHQCIGINPCGINQHLVNGVCQCLPGLRVIRNICQRCPQNQTYFPQFDACRCSQGFTLVNGACIFIICGQNQVYSADEQKCVCAFGYFLINGTCNQCNSNQVYDPTEQLCKEFVPPVCGFHEYWYKCCCYCERGYVKIRGQCGKCPTHSKYNWHTDSCQCEQGYYFVGQQVRLIPYQSIDTGSSITSNPRYTYSHNADTQSSPASNYDASGINTRIPNNPNAYTVPPLYGRYR